MADIKSLLNKKKWKGEEIGKALILNLVNDFKHKSEPDHKPLFSQSDLDRMTASIESERDGKAYNAYINLYNGVLDGHNRSEANLQQAQNGYYRLLMYVTNAEQAENAKRVMEQFPVIMTEKQYKETVEKAENEKRAIKESYNGLFFHAIEYYTGQRSGAKPTVPTPLKEIFSRLKKEPFTNAEILGAINREYGEGYYSLPDGSRSDEMDIEEWQELLREHWEKIHKDDPNYSQSRILKQYRRLYNGEIEHTEDDIEDAFNCTWHYYNYPPADLTKWDIIAGDYNMLEYYRAVSGEQEGKEEYFFNMFLSDFPELSKAIKADISAKLKKIDCPEDYILTWGDLADAKIYAYPELIAVDDKIDLLGESGKDRVRALYHGVAILRNDCITSHNTDENGYYKEPYSPLLSLLTGLDNLNSDESARFYIEKSRDYLLLPALREISAYNSLLSVLADEYGVPELVEMKSSIDTMLEQVEALNGLVTAMYEHPAGTQEDIERKRGIIKDLFPLIDLDGVHPTEAAIEAVRDKVSTSKDAIDLNQLIVELATSGKGAGEDE